MDWLNIHRSTLSAEAFLGCEPVQRATWLCLLAYCADQENGGRIEGAEDWGDRKWQKVVRITKSEAHETCPLWSWSEGVLIVWAYPVEKEEEVRRNRANGGKGGRPPKPANNQVVSSGLHSGLTEAITQTEPSASISAETEGNRKGIGKEGKKKEKAKGVHSSQVLSIYDAYPRHDGPGACSKQIIAALEIEPFDSLLEATQAFCAAVRRWDKADQDQFTPMASTWFSQQRWMADRKTWERKTKTPKNGVQHNGFFETDYNAGLDGVPKA